MNKLVYELECLWGRYAINVTFDDDALDFSTVSDIEGFTDKEGSRDPKEFLSLIRESGIEKWDSHYPSDDSKIEDAVRWKLKYVKDSKTYLSEGEEAFWPYGYDRLLEALKLLDEDLERFEE